MSSKLQDLLTRPLRDLRISVTDRCNFRCTYCMPKEIFDSSYKFLNRDNLLTFEEIKRIVQIMAKLGTEKVRLTGGEPLLRKYIENLIELIKEADGIRDISLTTNGVLLTANKADSLKLAGLKRITISLDSLNNKIFKKICDVDYSVEDVLSAIENAKKAQLFPIKVNMVVKKGLNETDILPMADYFRNTGVILRFIEYMDVGHTNQWQLSQVMSAKDIVEIVNNAFPIEPIDANYKSEVAKRWKYKDGKGEIGVIASVTQPFCHSCARARLSADGMFYTCLFATKGTNLKYLLREGADDEFIMTTLSSIWQKRQDRYSEIRSKSAMHAPKIEMSYIGG